MLQTDAELILKHLQIIKDEVSKHEKLREQAMEFFNSKEYKDFKKQIQKLKNEL